jgi:hypothetical protein
MVENEERDAGQLGRWEPAVPAASEPDAGDIWEGVRSDAKISAGTFRAAQVQEDGGFIFLRPPDDPEGPDWPRIEEPDPDDPCGGLPFVRAPLVAIQIRLQLGGLAFDCPSDVDRRRIQDAIRAQFARIVDRPQVQADCVDRVLTIALWPAADPDNPCDAVARQRGFDALDLIGDGENFGFFLSSSLVAAVAQRAFLAAPKRLSGNGAPSAFGPIHLTALSVEFHAPDRVKTIVKGYDDRPWPDVGFTLTITDVIRGDRPCATSMETKAPAKWLAVLGAVLLAKATVLLPQLLPLTLFVLAQDLEAVLDGHGDGGAGGEGGAGCRALGFVPVEASVPGNRKLELHYNRTEPAVTAGGLFFGGLATMADRRPDASLHGPTRLSLSATDRTTYATFRVEATDTFGTLSYRWSTNFGAHVESPTAQRTRILFDRGDRTSDSPPFTQTVRVTVTDEDGFAKTLAQQVELVVMPDIDQPAVCQIKPWLPQCLPR